MKVFIKDNNNESDLKAEYVETQIKEKFKQACGLMVITWNLMVESLDEHIQSFLDFSNNIDDLLGLTD